MYRYRPGFLNLSSDLSPWSSTFGNILVNHAKAGFLSSFFKYVKDLGMLAVAKLSSTHL